VTYTQIPDKGTPNFPPLRSPFPKPHESMDARGGNSTGKLPKLNFPTFTGDNPRLWLSRCENYFDMYNVEEFRWIQVASMYLNDATARWFLSVESKLCHASWRDFVVLLLDCFGCEQKELLIRQLFHIRQSCFVANYVECFAELIDQLTAYGHVTEPMYYAMRS
jgi:hypothetical protein